MGRPAILAVRFAGVAKKTHNTYDCWSFYKTKHRRQVEDPSISFPIFITTSQNLNNIYEYAEYVEWLSSRS